MLGQRGRVFSRTQIMDRVWLEPAVSLEWVLDTHIKTLRAKLREVHPESDPITTHQGLGYSISEPVHSDLSQLNGDPVRQAIAQRKVIAG